VLCPTPRPPAASFWGLRGRYRSPVVGRCVSSPGYARPSQRLLAVFQGVLSPFHHHRANLGAAIAERRLMTALVCG
jgi:hypothetical protein